jgi:hypothetical protein
MTSGPDGALWFTEAYGNKIGEVVLAPDAPANVTAAVTSVGQVTVSFIAPASSPEDLVTGFTVASKPAGGNDTNGGSTLLTHTVTGLANGTTYTFTVTATNAAGSTTSKPSNKVTTWAAPGKPAITSLTAGIGEVTVKFNQPKSTGGAINYTVTSVPGGLIGTGTSSPIIVSGLSSGTPYKFTVMATNAVGSTTSSLSKSITSK